MIKDLRRHQSKAEEIGREIHVGARDEKTIVAYVTPGGGKTLMASIYAHQLLKRDVSRVLVICPRTTLQAQMREGFTAPAMGLIGGLRIGYASSRSLLRDENAGCVTTYQDVLANPKKWRDFVAAEPTLVIFDEGHHLPDGQSEVQEEAGWTRAVRPIFEAAKRVLVMTGTMKREKGERIAFVDYNDDRLPTAHVRYTRRDALDEKAVLNVSVKLCDGKATYWHRFSEHRHTLATVSAEEESRALRTLLEDPDYRNKVLAEALADFARYRDTTNPNARMIVICANKSSTRSVYDLLREGGAYRPVLALSDEPDAHRRLARFRDKREGDILVTCQMAYEGLDVPDCTHLVSLTNYRARAWLEQALSRVTRFDPKCGLSWEEQCAFLYVPNDPSMVSFLSEWIDEQDARYDDPPQKRDAAGESPRGGTFRPESGELIGIRHGDTFGVFSDIDQRRINALESAQPFIKGMPTAHILSLAKLVWPNDINVPVPTSEVAAE